MSYKNRPALVIEVSPDLLIRLEDGRTQKVRPKDVVLVHPGPLPDLAGLEPGPGDAETAWEVLAGDKFTLRDLAELAFGSFTPASAWGAWQLLCDGFFFQGTPESITACPPEDVARKREAQQLKMSQKAAWSDFLDRVARRRITREDDHFLVEVEALALGKTDECRVLRELGRSQTPQNAHSLLLDLARWDLRFNPYPQRLGVPLTPPSIDLPELPHEPRLDLTYLPAFAIDDAGTTDPDDALSFESPNCLWVHVADAAALVPPDSPADLEARRRAAGLYLPEIRVPMLPPVARELLGLGLNDVSPALSFRLDLDENGDVSDIDIVPSWVRVTRLSYEQVEDRLQDPPFDRLLTLALNNEARRARRGAVNIDLPEVDIRLVGDQIVFQPVLPLKSRLLVKEAMLMAGEAAAGYALKEGIPIAFSTQEGSPVPELPEGLAGMYALRRFMKRGQIKSQPARHAGLGLDQYTQVTSPLRRYQDLIVHQQLRAHLLGQSLLTPQDILQRLAEAEAAANNLRQLEKLSSQHWTIVYLAENPHWQGEGIIVETEGSRCTALVPQLGLETHLHSQHNLALNTTVPLTLEGVNVPSLNAFFRIAG